MCRRVLNLLTLLSMSFSVAALAMWTRSRYVSESWALTPYSIKGPTVGIPDVVGWERRRIVGSTGGRLVLASADEWALFRQPSFPVGYRRGRLDESAMFVAVRASTPAGRAHGEIPGVAEWASIAPAGGSQYLRVVTVSWLVPAIFSAIPPLAWLWRRRRASKGPAFLVLPPEEQRLALPLPTPEA
jgi:hypothetical protein